MCVHVRALSFIRTCVTAPPGHKLLHEQKDIPVHGWSFECRVYAEVGGLSEWMNALMHTCLNG